MSSPTQLRDKASRLAQVDVDAALKVARSVPDPWFRAQALAAVARRIDEHRVEAIARLVVMDARLRDSVNGLDRRFDSRALSASAPTLDGDTVSLSWRLTLSKAGAPDFTATGIEHATFTDGAISRMEDVFDEGVAEALGAWMAAHGDSLGA